MTELVTGEAVVLGLRPAKLMSRAVAIMIDLAIVWGAFLLLSMAVVSATSSLDDAAAAAVDVTLLILILVGLPVAVETLSRGRSLGKLIFGLRVVREDGGPIRFRHALVRGAIGAVELQLSMGVIACIASLVSARGRRLGDVFAGTLVVRERLPAQQAAQLPPTHPWLAGQLTGADLSGLPDGLWLAIRQLLSRTRELDPQVSWGMAARLAGEVAARSGAPVPPGVPPAVYLAAVVAERQSRDWTRMYGNGVPAAWPQTATSPSWPERAEPGAGTARERDEPAPSPAPAPEGTGGGTGFARPG